MYYIMHGVLKSKTVLDSGFQALDSPADSLSMELRFQISIFSGIPDSLSWAFSVAVKRGKFVKSKPFQPDL